MVGRETEVARHLGRARDAASAQRWAEASGCTLEAWRLCWDPGLLPVLDTIDAKAYAPPVRDADEAWAARCRSGSPLDVAALCAAPRSRFMVHAIGRARLLHDLPKDPRIARWAVQQMEQDYQSALAGAWLDILERHGDASTGEALRLHYGRPNTQPAVVRALDRLDAIRRLLRARAGRAPADPLHELVFALAEAGGPTSLIGAIYADPDDMDLRAVYADHLLELGDARGELIALGLAAGRGEATPERERREAELWARYCKVWYAPIVEVVNVPASGQPVGFLHNAVARRVPYYRAPPTRPVGQAPACWQTVRSVDLAEVGAGAYLADPNCRHVTEVQNLSDEGYNLLRGATLPWVHLGFTGTLSVKPPGPEPLFPALTDVTLARPQPLFSRVPMWERVERVTLVDDQSTDIARAAEWMPRLRTITVKREGETLTWTRELGGAWRFSAG